jgi:protein-S-isoprenylcysteine O-methyltransferase Ste14
MTEDERAFQAYSKIAEQIIKEDTLVHVRMTWGLSINGALLALLGVGGGLLKDSFLRAPPSVIVFVCVMAALLSIVALLVCYWTIKGVGDARKQIYYISSVYHDKWKRTIEDRLGLPRPFGSRELYDKRRRVDRWWGDDLFRFVGALWFVIIVVCLAVAFYYALGGRIGADCSGITL